MMVIDTPTPTPTETETPTITPTPSATLGIPDRLYHLVTLAPSGPEVAIVYSGTAGEGAIITLLIAMLILGAIALFLELRVASLLRRK